MKTISEINTEMKAIREHHKHGHHEGLTTFFIGITAWFLVFMVLSIIASLTFTSWSFLYIPGSFVSAIIIMFADSEDVKRNKLATIEHVFTNREICNFEKGRHWRRFFFLRRRATYKNTPYEITIPIRETNCSNQIGINATVKVTVQLADGLAYEDAGGDKARGLLGTESRDTLEAHIRENTLNDLESEKGEDLGELLSEKEELAAVAMKTGHVIIKIDIIDLNPNEDYQTERRGEAVELAREKRKKIESRQRMSRMNTAKMAFIEDGFDPKEASKMAQNKINMEDGFLKETKTTEKKDYSGLNGANVIIN